MSCTPVRFVFGNVVRRSPVTILSPVLAGQADYLGNEHRSRICEFPANEPVVIEVTLLDGRNIDAVALVQNNLSRYAGIDVALFDNAGNSLATGGRAPPPTTLQLPIGTVWRMGIDPFDPAPPEAQPIPSVYIADMPETDATPVLLRITITDTTNPEGVIKLGMLFAGQAFRPRRNFAYGAPLKPLTDGALTETFAGHAMRTKLRRHARKWSLSLADMPEADRVGLFAEDEKYPNEPVLVSGYPEGTNWQQEQYNFVALFNGSPSYSHTHAHHYSTEITLAEV